MSERICILALFMLLLAPHATATTVVGITEETPSGFEFICQSSSSPFQYITATVKGRMDMWAEYRVVGPTGPIGNWIEIDQFDEIYLNDPWEIEIRAYPMPYLRYQVLQPTQIAQANPPGYPAGTYKGSAYGAYWTPDAWIFAEGIPPSKAIYSNQGACTTKLWVHDELHTYAENLAWAGNPPSGNWVIRIQTGGSDPPCTGAVTDRAGNPYTGVPPNLRCASTAIPRGLVCRGLAQTFATAPPYPIFMVDETFIDYSGADTQFEMTPHEGTANIPDGMDEITVTLRTDLFIDWCGIYYRMSGWPDNDRFFINGWVRGVGGPVRIDDVRAMGSNLVFTLKKNPGAPSCEINIDGSQGGPCPPGFDSYIDYENFPSNSEVNIKCDASSPPDHTFQVSGSGTTGNYNCDYSDTDPHEISATITPTGGGDPVDCGSKNVQCNPSGTPSCTLYVPPGGTGTEKCDPPYTFTDLVLSYSDIPRPPSSYPELKSLLQIVCEDGTVIPNSYYTGVEISGSGSITDVDCVIDDYTGGIHQVVAWITNPHNSGPPPVPPAPVPPGHVTHCATVLTCTGPLECVDYV
ncbi:hypothetical protein DRN67_01315 [Candidatus Micrarchaeota archaeon]|nr:MAG: hypothetical protein DRN67_01315 [Candidatus Micrarchaeota archaeon]